MPILTRAQVRDRAPHLALTDTVRRQLQTLLALDWDQDHRIQVERVHHEVLKADADTPQRRLAVASTALKRLVDAVNRAGQDTGLQLQVSTNKKAGAANRYLWFEGPADQLPTVDTGV
ncbi:MAG TPA: hypothetical protein VES73_00915, partial [Lamprocystis sp. (in: g-proteobacteria)]|nr:hypothetical protein [Lamprocystis sp. (in: g-proteobacteria)]